MQRNEGGSPKYPDRWSAPGYLALPVALLRVFADWRPRYVALACNFGCDAAAHRQEGLPALGGGRAMQSLATAWLHAQRQPESTHN